MAMKQNRLARLPTTACWRAAWPSAEFALHRYISADGMCTRMPSANLPKLCAATDRASYALVTDLRRRGLLDDTLVLWGGEFGRTVYSQGGLSKENYGRDHHPRCFTIWMAGGGAKAGIVHGQTDDFCYNVVKDPVHVRDFNATVLRLLGIDHEKLKFKFQGLEQKLTGVVPAKSFRN